MSLAQWRALPPAVQVAFVVMIWPAIWAAASMVMALVTDLLRAKREYDRVRATKRVVLH